MFSGGLIHALFARDVTPITADTFALRRRWDVTGPLTAFEAFDVAERIAREHDADAVPLGIATGALLDGDGRCLAWRFEFLLPVRRGLARLNVLSLTYADGTPTGAVEIEEAVSPTRAIVRSAPVLPVPFVDSSHVVRHWRTAHADTPATSLPCGLHTRFDERGGAWWSIALHAGEETRVPLAA